MEETTTNRELINKMDELQRTMDTLAKAVSRLAESITGLNVTLQRQQSGDRPS